MILNPGFLLKITLIFDSLINSRQEKGEIIPYLNESERVDVNPLLIHYSRANTLRKYMGLPLLEPLGKTFEPARDTAGKNTTGMYHT
jgi:hypothetical protein